MNPDSHSSWYRKWGQVTCSSRLAAAIREVNTIIEGERLVTVKSTKYFSKAIESPEQLNAALDSLRQDCENELGRGKKILIQ